MLASRSLGSRPSTTSVTESASTTAVAARPPPVPASCSTRPEEDSTACSALAYASARRPCSSRSLRSDAPAAQRDDEDGGGSGGCRPGQAGAGPPGGAGPGQLVDRRGGLSRAVEGVRGRLADSGADALEQPGGRLGRLRRVRQVAEGLAVLVERALAAGTARQVGEDDLLVVGLEGVQRVADDELVPGRVRVGAGHAGTPGSSPAVGPRPSRPSRSRRIPASMRVFTVPSGVCVSPAISRWV